MKGIKKSLAFVLTAVMICILSAYPARAAESSKADKETSVDHTGGKSRGRVDNSGSVKAHLGSLSLCEDGEELYLKFDEKQGYIADPDADYEEVLNSTTYKDNGFSKKDLKYMSAIIYCEANSMSHDAKVAVANVVLNRMRNREDNNWGHVNTIYDVIYDRKWGVQFAPTSGNPPSIDKALALYSGIDSGEYKDWQVRAMNDCIAAAKAALAGYKSIPDNFMYFNGYLDRSKSKCQERGSAFSIMNGHIYFTTDKLGY